MSKLRSTLLLTAVVASVIGLTPAFAQPASGGATGGGAVQGGSGAPGGGTGTPGAIVNGTTRTGIGTDTTAGPARRHHHRHHRRAL